MSQLEVDFVIDGTIGIEVKAAKNIARSDLKGLKALAEEVKNLRKIVVSRDQTHLAEAGTEIYHYADFFKKLWNGEIL